MAVAQNHIFFFGVPNVAAGSAPIFVIHCMSCLLHSIHPPLTHSTCSPLCLQLRSGRPVPSNSEISPPPTDKLPLSSWTLVYVVLRPIFGMVTYSGNTGPRRDRVHP
jgi:hypothetical protein